MTDGSDPCFLEKTHLIAGSYDRRSDGLTKREWFAGMAMQGILSGIDYFSASKFRWEGESKVMTLGKLAVEFADDLINALNESEEKK